MKSPFHQGVHSPKECKGFASNNKDKNKGKANKKRKNTNLNIATANAALVKKSSPIFENIVENEDSSDDDNSTYT